MNTFAGKVETLAVNVTFGAHSFTAHLNDRRTVLVPCAYSSRLAQATTDQRADYRLIGGAAEYTGRKSTRIYLLPVCSVDDAPNPVKLRWDIDLSRTK